MEEEKKLLVIGFEIDINDYNQKERLDVMSNEELRHEYLECEQNGTAGPMYDLTTWFAMMNGDCIDTENFYWYPIV